MNWDQIEGRWKQLTGDVKKQWGRLTDDDVDGYDFFAQQKRAEEAQAPQAPVSTAQLPTCDKFETWNCQPVCTESLTTGCTEARTPNAPYRDRYEGRRTFKGPEKSESPWSTL